MDVTDSCLGRLVGSGVLFYQRPRHQRTLGSISAVRLQVSKTTEESCRHGDYPSPDWIRGGPTQNKEDEGKGVDAEVDDSSPSKRQRIAKGKAKLVKYGWSDARFMGDSEDEYYVPSSRDSMSMRS